MFYKNLINLRGNLVNNVCKNSNFSTRNTSALNANNVPVKRSWSKIAIATGLPLCLAFSYYQFALNAKEKRRVRVNIKSIGRAIRSVKVGTQIVADYKWNLWNLDKVILLIAKNNLEDSDDLIFKKGRRIL